ncbi:MAG: hypothetical protein KDK45_26120 [Leptospiraceae bacterium]|nr:hypothetical protein [Leptospiraceae bacterium]
MKTDIIAYNNDEAFSLSLSEENKEKAATILEESPEKGVSFIKQLCKKNNAKLSYMLYENYTELYIKSILYSHDKGIETAIE